MLAFWNSLKALSEGATGFADLKKKTAIESGGHLQHHLTKLNGGPLTLLFLEEIAVFREDGCFNLKIQLCTGVTPKQ
jgi:hypothetical protein